MFCAWEQAVQSSKPVTLSDTGSKWSTQSERGCLHLLYLMNLISFLIVQVPLPTCPKTVKFSWKMSFINTGVVGEKNKRKRFLISDMLKCRRCKDCIPNTEQWSSISNLIKTAEVHLVVFTSWGWLQYCVCIGINIAWSSWHHLTGFLSDITPQHHGNMYADGYWIQKKEQSQTFINYCCSSVRGKVGEQHKHTHTDNWTHTHVLVSAVFGQFSSVLYPQQKDHKAVYET